MNAILWDEHDNPIGKSINTVLYGIRADDPDGLIYDAVTVADIIEDSDGYLATFDSLVTPYAKLQRKMAMLVRVMNSAVSDFGVVDYQLTKPFRQRGGVHVAVIFELTDGQTITIMFHTPVLDPKKIMPTDELVSWKWMINKKDVTIVVAPEKGKDIPVREVGRRVMKLAQRNSSAFQKANERRAERLQEISDYEKEIAELEAKLADLLKQIEVAKLEKEERELKALEKPIENRVGEMMKANGWTETFEGDNTILKKYFRDNTEIKASLINKKITLVADPVKEIQATLKLSDSDYFVNTEIEDTALGLADDLIHENKVNDPSYIISEYVNKLQWGTQRWTENGGDSQLKKEFTYGDFTFEVLLKVEAEKVIFTNNQNSYSYEHVIANSDLDDFDLEIKSQAEQYADTTADSLVLDDIKQNLEKLGFSSKKEDENNLIVDLKRTKEKFYIYVNEGVFEFDSTNQSYSISSNMDDISEIRGGFGKAKNKDIVVMVDELDFKSYEFDSDFDLDTEDGMPEGVSQGKSLKFAKSLSDLVDFVARNKKVLNIAIGDFNTTAGNYALFDDVSKQKGVYGITAQIGYIKYNAVLGRVSIDQEGNAIVYKGENGKDVAGSLQYGEESFINGFIRIFKELMADFEKNYKEPEPKTIFTAEQSEKLKNDMLKHIYAYETAIREYEKGDAIQELEALKPQAEAMLNGEMESSSDRGRLTDILKTVERVLDGTFFADIPDEDPEKIALFNRAVEIATSGNIELVKGLSDTEYQDLFNALVDKNYHSEAKLLEDMRNHKEPEPKIGDLFRAELVNKYHWLDNKDGDLIYRLNDDEYFTFNTYMGKYAVTYFNKETSDSVLINKFSGSPESEASLVNRKTQEYIKKLEESRPTPEPEPTPEDNKIMEIGNFLDDMIQNPQNHTQMESYDKLESIVNNLDSLPVELQSKADKAMEVYQAYALEQITKQMQDMTAQAGQLPS